MITFPNYPSSYNQQITTNIKEKTEKRHIIEFSDINPSPKVTSSKLNSWKIILRRFNFKGHCYQFPSLKMNFISDFEPCLKV